jgi:hypothetical protein
MNLALQSKFPAQISNPQTAREETEEQISEELLNSMERGNVIVRDLLLLLE